MWKAPSESEKKLLALTTKLDKLQAEKSGKRKEREENGGNKKRGKSGGNEKGKGGGKGKGQSQNDWKTQNPDNLKTKKVKGKVYNWCSVKNGAPEGCGCDKFVLHKPENCQGKAWRADKNAQKESKSKTLKVQEALTRASNDMGDELYASE
jgi:hypothetical protein